jgi:N-carbamoylputrescine amidase
MALRPTTPPAVVRDAQRSLPLRASTHARSADCRRLERSEYLSAWWPCGSITAHAAALGGGKICLALIQQHATFDTPESHPRIAATRKAAARGAEPARFAELAHALLSATPSKGDVRALAESVPGPTTDVSPPRPRARHRHHSQRLRARRRFTMTARRHRCGRVDPRCTRMVHITDYACAHERCTTGRAISGRRYATRAGRVGVAIATTGTIRNTCARFWCGAELVVPQAGLRMNGPPDFLRPSLRAGVPERHRRALQSWASRSSWLCVSRSSAVLRAWCGVRSCAARHDVAADIDLTEVARSHARRVLMKDRRPELYAD